MDIHVKSENMSPLTTNQFSTILPHRIRHVTVFGYSKKVSPRTRWCLNLNFWWQFQEIWSGRGHEIRFSGLVCRGRSVLFYHSLSPVPGELHCSNICFAYLPMFTQNTCLPQSSGTAVYCGRKVSRKSKQNFKYCVTSDYRAMGFNSYEGKFSLKSTVLHQRLESYLHCNKSTLSRENNRDF